MTQEKDYLGEQLHLAERAREEMYFRQLDQIFIAQMRQQEHAEAEVVTQSLSEKSPWLSERVYM